MKKSYRSLDNITRHCIKSILIFCFCIISHVYGQQNVRISGVVKSASQELLVGVTVRIVSENIVSKTDESGRFVVNVNAIPTNIEVSHTGYQKQTIAITNLEEVSVVLQEIEQILDEVVVVGYGTQRRKDLTGSIASV